MKDKILIKRNVLRISDKQDENAAIYAAKLFNQFGIVVDKPKYLTSENLKTVAAFYGVNIPDGFYKNPQDAKYFTCKELLIEQLVSYFTIAICGEESLNEEVFTRKPIFNKALPDYEEGKEVKVRYYRMLTNAESCKLLKEITLDLCSYTRKWSTDESAEFKWLCLNGYYKGELLKCKDNAIEMFLEYKHSHFASMLDRKDVVKMSVAKFGERQMLDFSDDDKTLFEIAVKHAYSCPLTRKQAKYFNSVVKNAKLDLAKVSNAGSVYKLALNTLKSGDVVSAARIFAANGSLLERNIVFLLSRANAEQAREIVAMIKCDNPIVLIQLLYGVATDDGKNKRRFTFAHNRLLKTHVETDDELICRKSVLSDEMREILIQALRAKIKEYYSKQPSPGRIYVSEQFKQIALPLNTSATGSGLDVLPTGSRLPIRGKYLRIFCYWSKAFDIDASIIFVKDNGDQECVFWSNYSDKAYDDDVLFSGDARGNEGAEYYDVKIEQMRQRGFKYAIFCLNGYMSPLDSGDIYCGYQDKDNLKTKAWSAKNIEFKMHVKGRTREYIGFAFDLERKETITLNLLLDGNSEVVYLDVTQGIFKYLDERRLETFSVYDLLTMRSEVVDSPETAEIVFDAEYMPATEEQQVIRPYDIDKLVSLLK